MFLKFYSFMRMSEAGLIPKWQKQYRADVRQCTEINVKQKHDKNKLSKLSINHYSGAFAALLIGYVASLTVYIVERIISYFKRSNISQHIITLQSLNLYLAHDHSMQANIITHTEKLVTSPSLYCFVAFSKYQVLQRLI